MKQYNWQNLSVIEREAVLQRPCAQLDISNKVADIIENIRQEGDIALKMFSKKFDDADISDIRVSKRDVKVAYDLVSVELLEAMKIAIERIHRYQTECLPKETMLSCFSGIVCQRIPRPIEKVGLYVPGGSAPLISTLMMLAIPAQVARCNVRVVCTPCDANGNVNPALLVAADLCDVDNIFKVGGAQAIAAMAYGTESIPKVDKIFGPGNAWVTEAKLQVAQDTMGAAIDMPAGPSEVLVIADRNANPEFVAADLLSQAEHGPDSQVLLLSDSVELLVKVQQCVEAQLAPLSRRIIAEQALLNSALILVKNIQAAIQVSNDYAPEHLILQVDHPNQYIAAIKNAGAVFVGPWTPETMGDYVNGSNHVLPTYGNARAWSGLSVQDFMKYISVQTVSQKGLEILGSTAMQLAHAEGLDAHLNAIQIRLNSNDSITNCIRSDLRDFTSYSSARMEAQCGEVWLNANESPWGNYNRYPEQQPVELINSMAAYYQIKPNHILATRGSDEAIDLLIRLFCNPVKDSILICPPTFGMYAVCARLQGAGIISVPLLVSNFDIDQTHILKRAREAKLIFLCSPNNPTGNVIPPGFLQALCETVRGQTIVIVDEAYIEYADGESFVMLVNQFPNLVVLRTLSKAFGLAAERIGALIAHSEIIRRLKDILAPYPLSSSSVTAAVAALQPGNIAVIKGQIAAIEKARENIISKLQSLPCVRSLWPSRANYILVQFSQDVYQVCLSQGVVLRDMSEKMGLENTLRISVGNEQENQRMLEVIENATV